VRDREPHPRASGWRRVGLLVLFLPLATVFALPAAVAGFPGLLGSHLPILTGCVLAGWILLALDGRGPAALGFGWSRGALREWGVGWVAGAVLLLMAVGLMTLSGGVRWGSGGGGWDDLSTQVGLPLLLLLIPAAAEEAFLRGYLFQRSAEWWGWGFTLAWTSVAFAVLHGANPGTTPLALVNLTLAGIVLGLIVLRTGSLGWASGAHLGWNWGQVALGLPVSGLELLERPVVTGVPVGPAWWGGGSFGVEGGVAATLVLGAASMWLWRGGGRGWIRPGAWTVAADSPILAGAAGARLDRMGLRPGHPAE